MEQIDVAPLFAPLILDHFSLKNRVVMAPMTRSRAPGNIPNEDTVKYYRARAAGGVGLIVTEGTYINPYAAEGEFSDPTAVPHFYGEQAIAGWRKVVQAVHEVGGKIFPQLWHVGGVRQTGIPPEPSKSGHGPSPVVHPHASRGEPAVEMTFQDIDSVISDYIRAASIAQEIGFDGVELHGAHGYLIDQFFWDYTNRRSDIYGGLLTDRTRFCCEIVKGIRQKLGSAFPICLRYSQWKLGAYDAKLARSPGELESFLLPLVDAGIDIFHCSTRRFYEPEFVGSNLNLAGWTKKITGRSVISVGSVGLDIDFVDDFLGTGDPERVSHFYATMRELCGRIKDEEFDLIAIGRSLIADPGWTQKVANRQFDEIIRFDKTMLNRYP